MRAAVVVALLCCLVAHGAAGKPNPAAFVVIVHPDNPATSVDRDFVRDAYLKKTTEWNGETLRPVDLSARSPVREKFTSEIIRKTQSQLKSYWNQQIFSGKGVPPPEVESAAAVVQYVLANKGAIGYVPPDADVGRAKVVQVE